MKYHWPHIIPSHPLGTKQNHANPNSIDKLQARRNSYAESIMAQAGINSAISPGTEIAAAFATLPREKFLGPPP